MTRKPAPKVIIRKTGMGDLENVTQLCAEHAAFERAPFDTSGHGERLRLAIAPPGTRLVIFLAEADGEAAGYAATTREFSTWSAREFLHMDCLFVTQSLRGMGIGRQLFNAVLDEAKAHGIAEMQWQTPDWNEDAIRFYRTLKADGQPKIRFSFDAGRTALNT